MLPAEHREEWAELILSELHELCDTSDSEKEEEEAMIDCELVAVCCVGTQWALSGDGFRRLP